jgi:flagellin
MSAVINTNLASLFAQNALTNAQSNLATSVQRLSSGMRINSSKDDASGLAIAQTMAGHISALSQSSLNAQQAINLAQTADSSLSTTQDILLRMQQLAVEGNNGSLSSSQKGAIVTELTNLNNQINAFAVGTTYNGINLLGNVTSLNSGSAIKDETFAIGGSGSAKIANLNVASAKPSTTFTFTSSTDANSNTLLTLTDNNSPATSQTLTMPATIGDTGSMRLNFAALGVSFNVTGPSAGTSSDIAAGLIATGTLQTAAQSNTSQLNFQVGADPVSSPGDSITINTINISTINGASQMKAVGADISQTLAGAAAGTGDWTAAFESLQSNSAIALNYISDQRAVLGSTMNQLGYINNNLISQSANEQAARSTVVDTNYSAETSSLTKGQIMQQAATAMLAQANQMPNVILSLLK